MAAKWTDFVSGDVLQAAQLNGVIDNFQDIAIFNESQASGTAGGTFTSGSYVKRTLNTTVVNNIASCSIASSVITLPAGTFCVFASAPGFNTNMHKTRLRNTSDSSDTLLGTSEYSAAGIFVQTRSLIHGVFTIAASKNFELQHRCETTSNTNGLGVATTFGDDCVFSIIAIARVA